MWLRGSPSVARAARMAELVITLIDLAPFG